MDKHERLTMEINKALQDKATAQLEALVTKELNFMFLKVIQNLQSGSSYRHVDLLSWIYQWQISGS